MGQLQDEIKTSMAEAFKDSRGRFNQHIYNASSSPKRKNSFKLYLFTLLGSTHIEPVHRTLMKLSQSHVEKIQQSYSNNILSHPIEHESYELR
jgi:hypothetical protein